MADKCHAWCLIEHPVNLNGHGAENYQSEPPPINQGKVLTTEQKWV